MFKLASLLFSVACASKDSMNKTPVAFGWISIDTLNKGKDAVLQNVIERANDIDFKDIHLPDMSFEQIKLNYLAEKNVDVGFKANEDKNELIFFCNNFSIEMFIKRFHFKKYFVSGTVHASIKMRKALSIQLPIRFTTKKLKNGLSVLQVDVPEDDMIFKLDKSKFDVKLSG